MRIQYVLDDELRELGIRSAMIAEVSGIRVAERSEELDAIKDAVAVSILKLGDEAIAADPTLEGYRDLVRKVGRSVKKFPPAAESLLRVVRRLGRFPTINTAVDSYNTIAAGRLLALGVHDRAKLGSIVRFRLSPGGEPFVAVGGDAVKTTQPGDYVYADENRVLAWLDSKDSDEVKVTLETTDLVVVIQGTAQTDRDYVRTVLTDACERINRFCGGTTEYTAID